jgi:hypothetical protein
MPPPPSVVVQPLRPRPSASDTNTLVFPLVGIRRMHVFLQASTDTRRETSDVYWTMSAWATLEAPLVAGTQIELVNLAPSLLTLAPLGASLMHVACAFWPAEPAAKALSIKFSTPADQPQGWAQAFGFADTTPHDFFGFFAAPFGYPRAPERLVEPLPSDPETLLRLQIEGRIPPPLAPPDPRRKRR